MALLGWSVVSALSLAFLLFGVLALIDASDRPDALKLLLISAALSLFAFINIPI